MDELKLIKKKYGEEMMHLCKRLFPTILEKEGLLYSILSQNIYPSKTIAGDIVSRYLEPSFIQFIYTFIKQDNALVNVGLNPYELMNQAGYTLYECKTQEDILSFKKYYKKGEELCTFNDNRLSSCYVFFAVKNNVDQIKRENFKIPKRQDDYSTSVISIQFLRGAINSLSIKSRYNHKVLNSDATFANNLENIIPGLTNSFSDYYGFNIYQNTSASTLLSDRLSCVRANNGKYYRYNTVHNNIYYCENNIIVDCGKVVDTYFNNREQYLFIETFILDLKNKRIFAYDSNINDSFIDSINIGINKVEIINENNNKDVYIYLNDYVKPIRLLINEKNIIIEYENDYIENIGNNFLTNNKTLKSLKLSSVKKIGNNFLDKNRVIKNIELDSVEIIGNDFLKLNNSLKECNLPCVSEIGDNFLHFNTDLEKINAKKVKIIGDSFLFMNNRVLEIDFPNLIKVGDFFLRFDSVIDSLNISNLRIIGDFFLYEARFINNIILPNVKVIGTNFIVCANEIDNVYMPNAIEVGDNFLYFNQKINYIQMQNIDHLADGSFTSNKYCKNVYFNNLKTIDSSVFLNNNRIKKYLVNNLNVEVDKSMSLRLLI